MKICKCACHQTRYMFMQCYSGCCMYPNSLYLNDDGSIIPECIPVLISRSIDDWYRDRRERGIEYYPTKLEFKKISTKKKR